MASAGGVSDATDVFDDSGVMLLVSTDIQSGLMVVSVVMTSLDSLSLKSVSSLAIVLCSSSISVGASA